MRRSNMPRNTSRNSLIHPCGSTPPDSDARQGRLGSSAFVCAEAEFNYLEQYAKGRYISTVISNAEPDIDEDVYNELLEANRTKKIELKEAKIRHNKL